nr:zf-CCHC domain-containing protein/DUF4219 domain-containing protein/UBN2 domain-containing protein [Tanacetum cinerariifolium]
ERKCFKCGDPNHLIGECPKLSRYQNQKAFVGGSWSDSDEDVEENTKDEKCLMAKASNEHFNSIVAFLEKGEKELEEEASKQSKRKSETSKEKATKKQKLDEEVEMILLVERRYPLIRFTLDQMLNNIRLEVEEESEVSLELLRFVRRQQQEGYRPE